MSEHCAGCAVKAKELKTYRDYYDVACQIIAERDAEIARRTAALYQCMVALEKAMGELWFQVRSEGSAKACHDALTRAKEVML